jgi:hypothetical protein
MSNNYRHDDDEEYEEEDEQQEHGDGNEFDHSGVEEDHHQEGNDKFKKFNEIAAKKGDLVVKPVSNDHYDIAYEMNESVDDDNVHMQNVNSKGGINMNKKDLSSIPKVT